MSWLSGIMSSKLGGKGGAGGDGGVGGFGGGLGLGGGGLGIGGGGLGFGGGLGLGGGGLHHQPQCCCPQNTRQGHIAVDLRLELTLGEAETGAAEGRAEAAAD